MKTSTFALASFERTVDHLFEAAATGTVDTLSGVSESIIMGTPMSVGTGLFKMVQSIDPVQLPEKTAFVFDSMIR